MPPGIRPDGANVGRDMKLSKTGSRVEQHAEAVADAVCELVDAVSPSTWSMGAVEDAAGAIDMLAEAVRLAAPGDLRDDAALAQTTAVDVVVVATVGIQGAGLAPGPAPLAPHRRHAVDQRQELRDVVAVSAGQ